MGIGEDFATLYNNLTVTNRSSIADRYSRITRALNRSFRNVDTEANSFYTGSYGRGTAIGSTSDVDMVFVLPYECFKQYDEYSGNGQSALLQAVRVAIKETYSVTNIGADGQVVVVPFNDGVTFEVVPAFLCNDGSYKFPDSNNGGSWRQTDPKPEIAEMDAEDKRCNGNLRALCRIMRAWKEYCNVEIKGLLIDTLAYNFIKTWQHRDKSFLYYDYLSRDYFEFLAGQDREKAYWLAPGSNQRVYRTGLFEWKATVARNKALEAIDHDQKKQRWSAKQKWREIYGTRFPD